MEDHPGVLQERIQVRAFSGRREDAQERVRREEHEEEEPHADQTHDARHAGNHVFREALCREGNRGAPPAERHRPEEDRALMRTPAGSHLVVPGQHRVGVVGDVEDRKVRKIEGISKAGKGNRAEERVCSCSGPRYGHERAVPAGGADKRQHALHDAERKAQDQCEVSDLRNHLYSPLMKIRLGRIPSGTLPARVVSSSSSGSAA